MIIDWLAALLRGLRGPALSPAHQTEFSAILSNGNHSGVLYAYLFALFLQFQYWPNEIGFYSGPNAAGRTKDFFLLRIITRTASICCLCFIMLLSGPFHLKESAFKHLQSRLQYLASVMSDTGYTVEQLDFVEQSRDAHVVAADVLSLHSVVGWSAKQRAPSLVAPLDFKPSRMYRDSSNEGADDVKLERGSD